MRDPGEVATPDLLKRVEMRALSPSTTHYIAFEEATEVAFVTVDVRPDCDFAVLYEIFVNPPARRKGVGTEIVRMVESLTRDFGRRRLIVHPKTLDSSVPQEALENWYARLGFKKRRNVPTELEKVVPPGIGLTSRCSGRRRRRRRRR